MTTKAIFENTDPPMGVTFDVKTGKSVALNMDLYSPGFTVGEAVSEWHYRYLGDMAKIWWDYAGPDLHVGVFHQIAASIGGTASNDTTATFGAHGARVGGHRADPSFFATTPLPVR